MRSANWVQETTTSIAGTSGDGAVTLTAIANTPRFSSAFGTQATTVRYVITKTSTGEREAGIGSVSSNVLTRTRPQVTWTGSAWDESTPSPLQFGATPTSGDVLVSIAPLAESQGVVIPGMNQTVTGDANWRDYPITNNANWNNSGATTDALTIGREYYTGYELRSSGLLTGMQFEVNTAAAGASLKRALYPIGHDGMPGAKMLDFTTTSVASTGIKTDTAFTPVWLTAGLYAIGFICDGAPALRGFSSTLMTGGRTAFGRHGGYGWGNTVYIAGNYATGLPTNPSLSGGTMISASNTLSIPWMGLRVVA